MTADRRGRLPYSPGAQEELKLREELKREALQTAAYCRLSVLNGDEDSIDTQMEITHSYIEENPELALAGTYVDNGFTGTNFERPGWNALIQDVRNGRINCIVVKDLSRLGRNHVETQHLIEGIFPVFNVRFISITDNFDSDTDDSRDCFLVPTKNIMNSLYAKDISNKIRASFENMKREGKLCNGNVPYGYACRDREMVIEPEEALMVRMIFKWAKLGVGAEDIAYRLKLMGEVKQNGRPWNGEHIRKILRNPAYTGTHITGKVSCCMKKKKKLPEEAWYVFEGHHEAIVSKEDFAAVNGKTGRLPSAPVEDVRKGMKMDAGKGEAKRAGKGTGEGAGKKQRKQNAKEGKSSPLSGIAFCSVCGRRMWHKEGIFYCRWQTGKDAAGGNAGKAPRIPEKELKNRVLRRCRRYRDELEEVRAAVRQAGRRGGVLDNITLEATVALAEKKKVENWGETLFSQLNRKEISEEEFRSARCEYRRKLEEKQEVLSGILKRQREAVSRISSLKNLIKASEGIERMKAEDVRTFVERVDVLPSGYTKIRLKCHDAVQELLKGANG